MTVKNEAALTVIRNWFEPVLKVGTMLVLAGVLYARQEARFTRIEAKMESTGPQMAELEKSLVSLRDEVIKLRIELAETRAVQMERGRK